MNPPPLPHEEKPRKRRIWLANLGFAFLCLLGLAIVLGTLWEPRSLEAPESFDPLAGADPELHETVTKLDETFAQNWADASVNPAPRTDDLALARRISLALTGTIPSYQEIRALEAVSPELRLDWWLAHVFEDPRYGDYVAERFARAYVGASGGPFLAFRRRRMVTWLAEQFQVNRPYDDLARDLITAVGTATSNPEVNFLTRTLSKNDGEEKASPDEIEMAARTTRAFLGVRIDCMQCHDDKLGDRWTQADFHQLAAFYAQAENSLSGIRENASRSYAYRYRGEREEGPVPAVVPFQPELMPTDGGLRERLADWATHPQNRAFSRTTANRVWALMFGKPLVEPIDDIPLDGELPAALDVLAADLVAHKFDLQRLVRIIAASRVFQQESRNADPNAEQHWASFPMTRLRPEQVAQSVIQASSLTTIDREAHIFQRLSRFGQTNDFVKRYGDLGDEEFAETGGTIPQRLLLMNGELMHERTKENLVMNAATRIAALAGSDHNAVETAYLAIFTRRPTEAELTHFVSTLRGTKSGKRNRAMEDLYWALMNATEFSWNH